MSVRLSEWQNLIEREYLRRFVPGGGSAIKFVTGEEPIIALVRRQVGLLAVGRGFDVIHVDAAATKLHMIHDVFFAVARHIDWEALAQRWVESKFHENKYEWPRPGVSVPLKELSDTNGVAETLLRKEVHQWLTRGIIDDREMAQDFRAAMANLCLRRMEMADDRAVAPVIDWLRGDLRSITTVREVPINARITRHNGRAMLQSLCRWLWLAEGPGLAVTIDLRQVVRGGSAANAESVRYTPAATIDVFEVLRQLIDEIESLKGVFIVVLTDPAFEDDARRGMSVYPALKERIWSDVHLRGRDNPLAPLVRLRIDEEPDKNPPLIDGGEMPFNKERVAIEALRAGVPNGAAISLLGSGESALIERFLAGLAECREGMTTEKLVEGEFFAGGFGSGKSHLLGYLAERALSNNFIVSRLAISKETPLFDPDRLHAAAIRHAAVPGRNDDVMTAVVSRLDPKSPAFDDLEQWASSPHSGLSPLFAALLYLLPKQVTTAEHLAAMASFFGGAKLGVGKVRQWLRAAGAAKLFDIKPVRTGELALQRIRFAPRLFKAAGFGGWCILLDEAELIGRYSAVQRGKSYAELCRWLGLAQDVGIPGIISVCAITDDFQRGVLEGKLDFEKIPRKLEEKGLDRQARLSEVAMNAIAHAGRHHVLAPPNEDKLRQAVMDVGSFYEQAYGWKANAGDVGERLAGKTMRQYIKSWITVWDVQRLFGEKKSVETEAHVTDYTENEAFEAAPELDPEVGAEA